MERQLFFLLIILFGIWLILDDVYGSKRLEEFIKKIETGGN